MCILYETCKKYTTLEHMKQNYSRINYKNHPILWLQIKIMAEKLSFIGE